MEAGKPLKVIWSKAALKNFKEAYFYIFKNSPKNAEKIRQDVFDVINSLAIQPEKFPADKFKVNNQGNFRAFELHSYRISYKFDDSELRVLRIRHVKMNPKQY